MATFGEFIKKERENRGLNQSDFGQPLDIIMTDISKIENGHKKFPFSKLRSLADFLEMNYTEVNDLFVADKLVDLANKHKCTESVFLLAAQQSKREKSKKALQAQIKFEG